MTWKFANCTQRFLGDRILQKSDLVITLGYDPAEYDASSWNPNGSLNVVHVDFNSCDYGAYYHPQVELLGSVRENILALSEAVTHVTDPTKDEFCQGLSNELTSWHADLDKTESNGLVGAPTFPAMPIANAASVRYLRSVSYLPFRSVYQRIQPSPATSGQCTFT